MKERRNEQKSIVKSQFVLPVVATVMVEESILSLKG